MSDIWTFDQEPEGEFPQREEYVGVPGDPETGKPTRIFPVPVDAPVAPQAQPGEVLGETLSDVDPEPIIPNEEYAANYMRLLKGIPRRAPPPRQPPPPSGPPPGLGHNQGPPIGPTPQEAHENIMRTIQPEPEVKEPLDLYTKTVDDLHPIKRAMGEKAGTQSDVAAIDNPYEQLRLTRGAPGKAEHMLRFGTFNFNDLSHAGESFEDIVKPIIDAGERDEFVSYLKARHAKEMEMNNIDSGVNIDDAHVRIANGAARYEPYAQSLDDFQENVLKYYKDSGIISQDAFDNMRQKWTTYIPFYRAFEQQPGAAKEFNVQNVLQRRTGSTAATLDPLEGVIRNTYSMTQMAERNRAVTTFIDHFHGRHPGQIPLQKVKQPVIPTRIHADETRRALEDAGIDTSGIPDSAMPGFDVFRHGKQNDLRPGEIAVFKNGKREIWKTDPAIAEAITKMNDTELGMFAKVAGVGARSLRAGVVLNPAYMLRNIHRDQISAFLQSKNNYVPYYDFLSGLKSVAKKDEAYRNWLKSGGAQATMVAQDRKYDHELMRKFGVKPKTLLELARRFRPLEGLRQVSEAMDNATRIGEFKRHTQGNYDAQSIMQGGIESRDVSQDFQRKGSKMHGYRHAVAFGGGQIQGLDREIQNIIRGDTKRRAVVAARIASGITLPTVTLWWYNKDDPRYVDASNQEKDRYWFLLPGVTIPGELTDEPVRITKGFNTGIGFSAPAERALDMAYRDRPEAFKDFAATMAEAALPGFLPTLVQPAAEHLTNRTALSKFQRPLIPRRLDDKVYPQEQYHPGTSETAKLVGEGLSKVPGVGKTTIASPIVIDNYIRGHGGDVAKLATKAIDVVLDKAGLTDKSGGEKAEKKPSDNPILGGFRNRYPSGSMQPIQDFYEKYGEQEKARNTKKLLLQRGRKEDANEIKQVMLLTGIKKQMDGLQRQLRLIQDDPKLNAQQKRIKLDQTYFRLLNVAKNGVNLMRKR